MKSQTTMTLAAAVLLAGATLAVVPASAALFSSSAPKASDSLTCRLRTKDGVERSKQRQGVERAGELPARDSSAIPSTLTVHAIPAKTASAVPTLRPYDYAKVNGKLLIVNPHDMMIAEVITG